MSNKAKYIDMKNRRYYFLSTIINIEHFNLNNIKIDKKSYKNIIIYYIENVTIKKICKNLQCKSFVLHCKKRKWIL